MRLLDRVAHASQYVLEVSSSVRLAEARGNFERDDGEALGAQEQVEELVNDDLLAPPRTRVDSNDGRAVLVDVGTAEAVAERRELRVNGHLIAALDIAEKVRRLWAQRDSDERPGRMRSVGSLTRGQTRPRARYGERRRDPEKRDSAKPGAA